MRAVVLEPDGVVFDPNRPKPEPARDEVLVRVLRAGICETDLQLIQGYMDFCGVLGHEFVGVAENGPFAGQRVVGEINCSCHACDLCHHGFENHCPHRSVIGILNHDGAFADYITVPQRNLHRVPDGIPTDEAVFTEPLAAAYEIPRQIPLVADSRVVVLGDGRLGNLCAQVVKQHGCRVQTIGKHADKLLLLDRAGIETALLEDVRPNRDADIVIDCTGSATGLPTALNFVKPCGTVVMKTTVAGEQTLPLARLVIDEITLVGSRCGPFPAALEALASNQIDVISLVSATYGLPHAPLALERARTTSVLKVLLDAED